MITRTRHLSLLLAALGALLASACDPDDRPTDAGPRVDGGDFDAGNGDVDAGDADAGGTDAGPSTDPCTSPGLPSVGAQVLGSFTMPTFATPAPGDEGALYVVEQAGQIQRRASDGTVTSFLTFPVLTGFERGLLALAFHPDYASNGRYFIHYTAAGDGTNTVAEMSRDGGSTPTQVLMSIPDTEQYVNGGGLAFGPDGYLYVGFGDGGGVGDNHGAIGNGLDTNAQYGKIHRLDVDNAPGFEVASNPFASGGGLATVWAYGLRNPWRISFDSATGDLWISDVGENLWEEINYQPASSSGGENYGWRAYEGLEVVQPADVGLVSNHAEPVHAYNHSGGRCAVVGGVVYRGSAMPSLSGFYVFGDYCTGEIFALRQCGAGAEVMPLAGPLETGVASISSFGTDADGELLLIGGSSVARLVSN